MTKPYDVTTKQLVETDPMAWIRLLNMPGEKATLVNAELSTVTSNADRIIKVSNPDYLMHIELQASYDKTMDERMHVYNALAHYKHHKPVESVVVLLRRKADGPKITGRVQYGSISFEYQVVRLWQISPDVLLNAPIALLPLAPLGKITRRDIPNVIQHMEDRIDAEAPAGTRDLLWATTSILMGLKFSEEATEQLLKGVMSMKESSVYQAAIRKGMADGKLQGKLQGKLEGKLEGAQEGRLSEARELLLLQGNARFGKVDKSTQTALDRISSREQLEQLCLRLLAVNSWQELLN